MILSTACFFFSLVPFLVFFGVCEFIIKLRTRTGHFTTFPHSLSVKKRFCARPKKNDPVYLGDMWCLFSSFLPLRADYIRYIRHGVYQCLNNFILNASLLKIR